MKTRLDILLGGVLLGILAMDLAYDLPLIEGTATHEDIARAARHVHYAGQSFIMTALVPLVVGLVTMLLLARLFNPRLVDVLALGTLLYPVFHLVTVVLPAEEFLFAQDVETIDAAGEGVAAAAHTIAHGHVVLTVAVGVGMLLSIIAAETAPSGKAKAKKKKQ